MQNFRVYDGESNNIATRVFGGKSSGIRDWDDVKYPQMLEFSKDLFAEYWIEDEIKLGKDMEEFREKLTNSERSVYATLTGKLNWLDSIATDFNFVLGYLCTDSSVRSIISLIASFEQLHNRSYQYLTSSVLNQEEKEKAFSDVQQIPELVHRNELIIKPIQEFLDVAKEQIFLKEDEELSEEFYEKLIQGIIAEIILEGLYFTGGFVFFHSLARDQKMMGSNNMINLIKTDENMHSQFMGLLLQIVMKENPKLATTENYNKMMNLVKEAVVREKKWSAHIFKDIDTLSIKEYHNYVEYLANLLCRNAGLEEPFPANQELKSKWIVTYGSKKSNGDADQIVTRADFLQSDAIDYAHESGEDFDL